MKKTNFDDALRGVTEFLQGLIADKLDINRLHIEVLGVCPKIIAEASYEDEDDNYDIHREIGYRTRYWNAEKQVFEYSELKKTYWCHTESMTKGYFTDVVVTEEEFKNLFDDGENA